MSTTIRSNFKLFVTGFICTFILNSSLSNADTYPILIGKDAATQERWAASELRHFLSIIYPQHQFPVQNKTTSSKTHILLGSLQGNPELRHLVDAGRLDANESYVVTHLKRGKQQIGIIAGSDARATLSAVYALLEQLGYGFYLYTNAAEAVVSEPFSFDRWQLADSPVFDERVVFNWYNFISGVSAWNLEHYQDWIRQAARMRYTSVMLHAYSWNPLHEFSFNGQRKPVKYLQNTRYGKDWGNYGIDDISGLIGADALGDEGPIFGADVGKIGYGGVTMENRVAKAKAMMREVVDYAVNTVGLEFNWAFDVDTLSANPQNLITTLPESSRIKTGGYWIARPDTEEGYKYYKAMIKTMMDDYPGIGRLTLWWRTNSDLLYDGLINALAYEEMPASWQLEYDAAPAEVKGAIAPEFPSLGPAHLFYGKLSLAFRKALNELGHDNVKLGYGSWIKTWHKYDSFTAANYFQHPGHTAYALEYEMNFDSVEFLRNRLKLTGDKRRLIVIEWAQHDDGMYMGRPYTPPTDFATKLAGTSAEGYGVIHWTTRPLDVFFKNLQNQVWRSTLNEHYTTTTARMAKDYFGENQAEAMARYLDSWLTGAPQFGRETTPLGWTGVLDFENRVAGVSERIALLNKVNQAELSESALARFQYFYGHEEWIRLFHLAQKDWDQDLQKATIKKYVEKASVDGGMTRGEQGLMLQHSIKWLDPKYHITQYDEGAGH